MPAGGEGQCPRRKQRVQDPIWHYRQASIALPCWWIGSYADALAEQGWKLGSVALRPCRPRPFVPAERRGRCCVVRPPAPTPFGDALHDISISVDGRAARATEAFSVRPCLGDIAKNSTNATRPSHRPDWPEAGCARRTERLGRNNRQSRRGTT